MRSICVRWACFLAAFSCASAAAGQEPDHAKPAFSVLLRALPRGGIEEEEQDLLGVPEEPAKQPEEQVVAKAEPVAAFVVTCKLVQPKQKSSLKEPSLVVAAVPAGKPTKIPLRSRVESSSGAAEFEELRLIVPGTDGAELVAVGHEIIVKVGQAHANRVRLDAAVDYRICERKNNDEMQIAGRSGRFIGEVTTGKPAQVVLETNDDGQPKHWVEFIVRFADEETDERAAEASRVYPVAYSVAGLVGVGKKAKAGKRPELDFAPIIEKIETKVAPKSWAGAGGPGKIQAFARTASLVVTQTAEVHKELASYLRRLIDDEDAIQQAIYEER